MPDLILALLLAAFFAFAWLFTLACEKL